MICALASLKGEVDVDGVLGDAAARLLVEGLVDLELRPVREGAGALDDVAQLAHVARPVVVAQAVELLLRHLEGAPGRELAREVIDEQRDVVGPLAQRRNGHPHDGEAVVEILAEPFGGDLGAQGAVGRRDHAHRDLLVLGAAHGPHGALVERAQQRRLHLGRELADLVEEQRAAVRLFEGAGPIRDGAREGPAQVPEERRLDELLGHGAAVEDDERSGLARAVTVDLLGEQLLARCPSRPR
jgi:hypothetical protein